MYLLDTNILIYHFHNELPLEVQLFVNHLFENSFNISLISKIEFLGFKNHTHESFKLANEF